MQIPPFLPYISVKQCLLLLLWTSMHSNRIRTAHVLTDGGCFMTPPFMAPPSQHPTPWNPPSQHPPFMVHVFHRTPFHGTPYFMETPWMASPRYHSPGWNPLGGTPWMESHNMDGNTPSGWTTTWMETPLNGTPFTNPPPPEWIADRCKNITLPQIRLRAEIVVTWSPIVQYVLIFRYVNLLQIIRSDRAVPNCLNLTRNTHNP